MVLVVCTSPSVMVCTSDRFARSAEGKAVGFDCVTTVLDDVSACGQSNGWEVRLGGEHGKHTFAGCAADCTG